MARGSSTGERRGALVTTEGPWGCHGDPRGQLSASSMVLARSTPRMGEDCSRASSMLGALAGGLRRYRVRFRPGGRISRCRGDNASGGETRKRMKADGRDRHPEGPSSGREMGPALAWAIAVGRLEKQTPGLGSLPVQARVGYSQCIGGQLGHCAPYIDCV